MGGQNGDSVSIVASVSEESSRDCCQSVFLDECQDRNSLSN